MYVHVCTYILVIYVYICGVHMCVYMCIYIRTFMYVHKCEYMHLYRRLCLKISISMQGFVDI